MDRLARQIAALAVVLLLLGTAGCGSGKPGYCADRSRLEQSIKDVSKLDLSSGLAGVEAQLKTIQADANALVAAAKSDFPTQTSAIRSSIDTLAGAIRALPSNPTPAQIASLATGASSVVTAVGDFVDATKSKCG